VTNRSLNLIPATNTFIYNSDNNVFVPILGAGLSILSHIVNFILLVFVVALVANQVPVWIAQVFFAAVSFAVTIIMFSYLIQDTKRKGKSA
jgi:uncharacterized membrane protein YdbT with pleckstrin-like domain